MSILNRLIAKHPDLLAKEDSVHIVIKNLISGRGLETALDEYPGEQNEYLGAYGSEVSCLLVQFRFALAKMESEAPRLETAIQISNLKKLIPLLEDHINEIKDLMFFRAAVPTDSSWSKMN